MGNADGKSNPFNTDGASGAVGNKSGGSQAGMSNQRGPDRPQKMGAADFNPDSVADGGRIMKLDPPSDRQGMVNQTAAKGMAHKPFKLGGKGPAMPAQNAEPDEGGPVGDIPNSDTSDQ
jgi:hypothetical protein